MELIIKTHRSQAALGVGPGTGPFLCRPGVLRDPNLLPLQPVGLPAGARRTVPDHRRSLPPTRRGDR